MESDNILRKFCVLSTQVTQDNRSVSIVKSNLMLKYKLQAKQEGLEIDTGPMCCKWCFNTWSSGNYKVTLKPQKHPKHRLQSLLNKDVSSLNKYQQKWVGRIKKCSTVNTLVIQCLLCFKNTSTPLRKENTKSKTEENKLDSTNKSKTKIDSDRLEIVKKKKKKKKKDVYAGLNSKAVQRVMNPVVREVYCKPKPIKPVSKKPMKDISLQQQLRIHRALIQTPQPMKKPSLLATFLENM